MKLLTKDLKARLLKNGQNPDQDHIPVVKFFNPCGPQTWLFNELDPDEDRLFGLCDMGMGCPELGYASLSEIAGVRGPLGIGIERDTGFRGRAPMSVYAKSARNAQRIVEFSDEITEAFDKLNSSPVVSDPNVPEHAPSPVQP